MSGKNIVRAFNAAVSDVDKGRRSLVARINTDAVDRYQTVIDPAGGQLEAYQRNPAVLWEHGKDPRRFTDPIGRNLTIQIDGSGRSRSLLARTKFLEDDFSQQRFEWYRDGTLNAFSVNILPRAEHCGAPTREELRARPEWGPAQLIYRRWDLLEYSGTTIPGNAECLVTERKSPAPSAPDPMAIRAWARRVLSGPHGSTIGILAVTEALSRLQAEHRRARALRAERRAAGYESWSAEEIAAEIERLKLLAQLEELLGKREQAKAHAAQAAAAEKMKQEFASQAAKGRG
jgi:hypothetical protein